MAVFKSVEYIEVSITAATEGTAVNLSKGQDETQCVPFFSVRSSTGVIFDGHHERMGEVEIIDNSGTAAVRVSASARAETDTSVFQIFVVEFDASINVQQVDVAGLTNGTASTNVTLDNDVTAQADAFMIYSYQYSDTQASTDDWDDAAVQVRFNGASTTSVTLSRRASDGACNGTLFVVDCDSSEWTVQHEEIDVTSAAATSQNTSAFTAVVEADAFILHTYETSEAEDDIRDGAWVADLNATTTARVRRGDASPAGQDATSTHSIQIVECNNNEWDVQREDALTLASATQNGAAITAIDETRSFISVGNHSGKTFGVGRSDATDGTFIEQMQCAADFVDTTHVRFRMRVAAITTGIIGYEVIQFASSGLPGFHGANRGIMRGVARGVG